MMPYIYVCFLSVSCCCVLEYMLTYVYEHFIGKKLSYNENGNFNIYLVLLQGKLTIGEKWLYQLGAFNNIVVLPVARKRGTYSPITLKSIK